MGLPAHACPARPAPTMEPCDVFVRDENGRLSCSFCGSLSQYDLFASIEFGDRVTGSSAPFLLLVRHRDGVSRFHGAHLNSEGHELLAELFMDGKLPDLDRLPS